MCLCCGQYSNKYLGMMVSLRQLFQKAIVLVKLVPLKFEDFQSVLQSREIDNW